MMVNKYNKYQRILVPLDGFKLAEKALPYAQSLVVKFGSEIILLNVRLPAEDPYHPALESYLEKTSEIMKQDIQASTKFRLACAISPGTGMLHIENHTREKN